MEPASGCCRPIINFNKTLLPVPLRPRTASVSPCATSRSIPFNTVWSPKDLRNDCHLDCWRHSLGFHPSPHGKNTRMNRTSKTSARMMKIEDRTTELAAARSTPSVPPCARMPSKDDHQTDNQTKYRGLKRRRQEVVEGYMLEARCHEKAQGDRFDSGCLRATPSGCRRNPPPM